MCIKLPKKRLKNPEFVGSEWSFDNLHRGWDIIKTIAKKYNWEGYPVQFEVLSSEQMLDMYASNGMPTLYSHWSFGKRFLKEYDDYVKGHKGLAYELIINTNPSICYIMEDNTQMMQLLVTAHAAVGHNHFFKNNYLFKEWTKPDAIIDYLAFARNYIKQCEEKYGSDYVEITLDAAHALFYNGISKYKKRTAKKGEKKEKVKNRIKHLLDRFDPVLDGNSISEELKKLNDFDDDFKGEENILYFLEKKSPVLESWQREILRIVRKVAQYFYPQIQTKMINEGFASFVHYTLMNDLYELGYIDEGYILEFLDSHTAVLNQPDSGGKRLYDVNPYYLGFNIFKDVKRICENPTEEDKKYYPDIAGSNWIETINFIVSNYKDETFVSQFLSPKLIRDLKMFLVSTRENSMNYTIDAIHSEEDYNVIREQLAEQYKFNSYIPGLEVSSYDKNTSIPILNLKYEKFNDNELNQEQAIKTLEYLMYLWGGAISMNGLAVQDDMAFDFTLPRVLHLK